MSDTQLEHISQTLRQAVVAGGEQALHMQQGELREENKGGKDFATNADIEVQKSMIALLTKETPNIPIVAEEHSSYDLSPDSFYVVDPIDGTYVYAAGATQWGVTAAYFENGKPQIGYIYQPACKRLLSAERGKGCFLNDQPLTNSWDRPLAESIIGISQGHWNSPEQLRQVNIPLTEASLCVLTTGAAIDGGLTLLSGVTVTYVNQIAKIWDFAAVALAVEEAGGVCSHPDGQPFLWDTVPMQAVFSVNQQIHDEVLGVIKEQHLERK